MARILYVEDEASIRQVIEVYLSHEGYDVLSCSSVNEAKSILAEDKVDLAVLDIMLPDGSGLDVLRFLRQSPYSAKAGVIMLTALDNLEHQVAAFDAWADDYIVKPVLPVLLLKRMNSLLRRLTTNQPSREDGFVLDREGFRVMYNGETLGLTLTEFLLFKTLYQCPKKVFSRNQLLDAAFGEEAMLTDRVIDAHIKNMRKKLPINCIKTVIGIGYQFQKICE